MSNSNSKYLCNDGANNLYWGILYQGRWFYIWKHVKKVLPLYYTLKKYEYVGIYTYKDIAEVTFKSNLYLQIILNLFWYLWHEHKLRYGMPCCWANCQILQVILEIFKGTEIYSRRAKTVRPWTGMRPLINIFRFLF